MSTPFTAVSSLTYPPDDGEDARTRSNTVSGSYDHKAEFDLVLEGSGTQSVDFGSISTVGAKAIQVEAASDNTAPVMVEVNGNTPGLEVSAGGHIEFANPTPTASGILSMDVVYTVDSKVKIRILG